MSDDVLKTAIPALFTMVGFIVTTWLTHRRIAVSDKITEAVAENVSTVVKKVDEVKVEVDGKMKALGEALEAKGFGEGKEAGVAQEKARTNADHA